MDSHLKGVPGFGTLSVRSLTGGDTEVLGWETDWALDAEVLGLGALEELAADLLEGLDLARGEGDADLVDLWGVGLAGLLWVLERHFGGRVVAGYWRVFCLLLEANHDSDCGLGSVMIGNFGDLVERVRSWSEVGYAFS